MSIEVGLIICFTIFLVGGIALTLSETANYEKYKKLIEGRYMIRCSFELTVWLCAQLLSLVWLFYICFHSMDDPFATRIFVLILLESPILAAFVAVLLQALNWRVFVYDDHFIYRTMFRNESEVQFSDIAAIHCEYRKINVYVFEFKTSLKAIKIPETAVGLQEFLKIIDLSEPDAVKWNTIRKDFLKK